jgi:flagellar hook-length control protein FliK
VKKTAHQARAEGKSSAFMNNLRNIVNNAKVFVRDGKNGSFALKLYPPRLGSVNINIGLEQGIIQGKFLVENVEAKDLLMENINNIKEQLREAGISVGEFQVSVQDQRRNMLSDRDGESYPLLQAETADDVAVEFEANSLMLHDGSVNLVI